MAQVVAGSSPVAPPCFYYMKTVLLGFSGGVDSIYSAILLKKSFDVVAIHLKMNDYNIIKPAAENVLKKLNIPLIIYDIREIFQKKVINYFKNLYRIGFTPNPCMWCNKHIKIKILNEFMFKNNFNFFSTGHYVITNKAGNLFRGKDLSYEQSYFLSLVSKDTLRNGLFPLGEKQKLNVNKKFSYIGTKPSQDICFLKNSIEEFLLNSGIKKREFYIHVNNKVFLREAVYFTPGQRKGFKIPFSERLYVESIKNNHVYLANREHIKKHTLDFLVLNKFHPLKHEGIYNIQIRYRSPANLCKIYNYANKKWHAECEKGYFAPAKGQFAVLYKDDEVQAGSLIL